MNLRDAPFLDLADDELVIDGFAGGGGASTGITWALGRDPDIAVNHNPIALAMHKINHPNTRHCSENIRNVNWRRLVGGRRVGLGWFSPDCTFFSAARGGQPFRDPRRAHRIRGLPNSVTRCARMVRPRVIIVENVREMQYWGPVLDNGLPCPIRRSLSFRRWIRELENLGYRVEYREEAACDFGAPTSRSRLFITNGPERNRILGIGLIANDGTINDAARGNYDATFSKMQPKEKEVWKRSRVKGFDRVNRGVWDLIYLALRNCVHYRNRAGS